VPWTVPPDDAQLILPSIEERTGYVTSFPWTIDRDHFSAHMAVVGDIVYFDIEAAFGRPPYAYVRYVNADAQRLAIAMLDCTAIDAGQTPIRVFLFLDSKLFHRPPAACSSIPSRSPTRS
jgi:hypothetical protein